MAKARETRHASIEAELKLDPWSGYISYPGLSWARVGIYPFKFNGLSAISIIWWVREMVSKPDYR